MGRIHHVIRRRVTAGAVPVSAVSAAATGVGGEGQRAAGRHGPQQPGVPVRRDRGAEEEDGGGGAQALHPEDQTGLGAISLL